MTVLESGDYPSTSTCESVFSSNRQSFIEDWKLQSDSAANLRSNAPVEPPHVWRMSKDGVDPVGH